MKTILETPRLLLREMSAADIDFLADLLAHPEVMRYWPRCHTRQESADWIERQRRRYATHGVGYWLALDKSTGEPVGQAGLLMQQVDGAEETDLGYIIHRPFWRRGFATEAATASRDYAFKTLGRKRVIALVRPENTPSRGVALKLGMRIEKQTFVFGFDHLVFVSFSETPAGSTPLPLAAGPATPKILI